MTPETWLPTWTVVTAETVPVAVTVMVTVPRETFSVRYCSAFLPPAQERRVKASSSVMALRRTFKRVFPLFVEERGSLSYASRPFFRGLLNKMALFSKDPAPAAKPDVRVGSVVPAGGTFFGPNITIEG